MNQKTIICNLIILATVVISFAACSAAEPETTSVFTPIEVQDNIASEETEGESVTETQVVVGVPDTVDVTEAIPVWEIWDRTRKPDSDDCENPVIPYAEEDEGFGQIPPGTITEDGTRIFWTIYVDAFDALDIEEVARKELSIWDIEDGEPRCLLSKSFPLRVSSCTGGSGQATLNDQNDISLSNCYLEIKDEGLSAQAGAFRINLEERLAVSKALIGGGEIEGEQQVLDIKNYLQRIEDWQGIPVDSGTDNWRPEGVLKILDSQFLSQEDAGLYFYAGENVRLDVQFRTDTVGIQPLFYHPQFFASDAEQAADLTVQGAVKVTEEFADSGRDEERTISWQIRADESLNLLTDTFKIKGIDPIDQLQYLMARQDQNLEECLKQHQTEECLFWAEPQFDFNSSYWNLVDLRYEPLNNLGRKDDQALHLFSTGPTTFTVGLDPNQPGNMLSGQIRSIEFDPNASCYGCGR